MGSAKGFRAESAPCDEGKRRHRQLHNPSRRAVHNCAHKHSERFRQGLCKNLGRTRDPELTPCKCSTAESLFICFGSLMILYTVRVRFSMGCNPTWDCFIGRTPPTSMDRGIATLARQKPYAPTLCRRLPRPPHRMRVLHKRRLCPLVGRGTMS